MSEFIPVNEPLLNGNEKKYLNECIDSGWISSEGPFVTKFENTFAKLVNRKHAIAVCNGTAALDLAVEALDVGPGDEVIMPTFTIISCITQIIRAGATPVLVDSDPNTWNMDISKVEACITPLTKVIMVVHIYGLPANIGPLLNLAARYGIKVIEDAAEMHGQTYDQKPCGSFGDISTFSFYPNKHITTGEGGMVVTNDDSLAESIRELRNLCMQSERRFLHDRLGWNMRMTNLQAALGVAQLERLDEFVQRKRAMGRYYLEGLKGIKGLQLPQAFDDHAHNIFWVFGLILKDELPFEADHAIKRLASMGVGSRPFFWPMHEQPILINRGLFLGERYPVAERLARRGLYIPSGMAISKIEMDKVIESLHNLVELQ